MSPMVMNAIYVFCDDTDLVTNLDTKQKRLTEVSLCCRGIPRIYWLLWVMRLLIGIVATRFQ